MSFPTPFYNWRRNQWHGIEISKNPTYLLNEYVKITPFDIVKCDVKKITRYFRVDKPHRTFLQPHSFFGFIPKIYCGKRVKGCWINSNV